jgi:hypothetical protein
MRDNRLQLVAGENSEKATADAPTEPSAPPASPDAVMWRLRPVEADDAAPPDDAA